MSLRDRLQRRVFPRIIVAASTVRVHRKLAADIRRAIGGSATVRLFVAFDDPYSAIALIGLADRVAGRRVSLIVEPVIERGIPDDPALEAKRRYAVTDSARLARRLGLELVRSEPIAAGEVAALAREAAALPPQKRLEFSLGAMRRLWFETGVTQAALPAAEEDSSLPGERRMRRRRLYDTPVAVTGGQWFFAHERLDQIASALDELGWRR